MLMAKKNENEGTFFQKSKVDQIFCLVKDPKTEKVKIVIGQNVVSSKEFHNFVEADIYINKRPYELIINSACLFMTFAQNSNNNENKK